MNVLMRFVIVAFIVMSSLPGGNSVSQAGVVGNCLSDAAAALFDGSSVTGCTANDGNISNIDLINVVDGCVNSNDTAVVSMKIALEEQPASTRYNAGIFVNRDGRSALSGTGSTSFDDSGQCFHEALFPAIRVDSDPDDNKDDPNGDPTDSDGNPVTVLDSGIGPFSSRDNTTLLPDYCGDTISGQVISRTLVASESSTDFLATDPALIRIKCSDVGSYVPNKQGKLEWTPDVLNGGVDISACVAYQQNASNEAQKCNDITKAVADTTSKCSCRWVDTSDLDVNLYLPNLQVGISCTASIAPGDPYECTVTYSNINSKNTAADYIEFQIPFPSEQVSVDQASFQLGSSNSSDSVIVDIENNVLVLTPLGNINNDVPTKGNVPANFSGTLTYTLRHIAGSVGTNILNRVVGYSNNITPYSIDNSLEQESLIAEANTNVTAALVSSFSAITVDEGILVEWETELENGTVGYYLERWDVKKKKYLRINEDLLPGLLYSTIGGSYAFVDTSGRSKGKVKYRIVEVESEGNQLVHGPFEQVVSKQRGKARTVAGNNMQHKVFAKSAKVPTVKQKKLWTSKKAQRKQEHLKHLAENRNKSFQARAYVKDEGLYYLSTDALAEELNVAEKVIVRHMRQDKILIKSHGEPLSFLPTEDFSGFYFYAEAIDNNYSSENVYQIELVNYKTETLMESIQGDNIATQTATTFPSTIRFEEDVHLVTYANSNPGSDPWFGGFVSTGYWGNTVYTVNLDAPDLVDSGLATIRLYLQGATDLVIGNDHQVDVRINGSSLDRASWITPQAWDGKMSHIAEVTFDLSLLKAVGNTIEIYGLLPEGVEQSSFVVDSVELQYQRAYRANNDQLMLTAPSMSVIKVEGFQGSDIAIFDISDKKRAKIITNSEVTSAGAGYDVMFGASRGVRFLAISYSSAKQPVRLERDIPSKLKDASNIADYLIIAPKSLHDGAEVLATHRGAQFETMVVDLQDIYDEFNYGVADAKAIREFLSFVWGNWDAVPKFVVLAGKGTLDPKDIRGYATNILPVILVSTPRGLFASDTRLGDVAGDDGVPEYAIGRIPVLSSDDLVAYVEKIKGYEQAKAGSLSDNVVLLTDNADYAGNYPVDGDSVALQFPESLNVTHYSHPAGSNVSETRQAVFDALEEGTEIFNYIGHGSLSRLGHEGYFSRDDADLLTNSNGLPFFIASTCYVGNGTYPGTNSLAEHMLWNAGGGAVGVWAPTGMSINDQAVQLNIELLKAIYTDNLEMGDATKVAGKRFRSNGGSKFMVGIYNYIGDPALKIR